MKIAPRQLSNMILIFATLLAVACLSANAQQTSLQLDPARTSVKFTLGDVLHTVHGTFQLKTGSLQLDTATGMLSGQIVVDARSGESGSNMRDRKMHREVLESERYPEISFRPDRVDGSVTSAGKSSVKVHGIFNIHGVEREISVPAEVEMSADHWSATVHFTVPYQKWGMKNPSTLFLRVNDSVEIDLVASGNLASGNPEPAHSSTAPAQ
ncbi:MAG TPA: YceI family protein [Candidatus Solibacter sp.]|nr:YceI family protein [Candidatus Solibacter sp.]